MKVISYLIIYFTLFIAFGFADINSKFNLKKTSIVDFQKIRNNEHELEIFPKRDDLSWNNRINSLISYNDGSISYGEFVFNEGDSIAVWFRPLTECHVNGIEIYFPESTDLAGTQITVVLRQILNTTSLGIDGNGSYDFSTYNITIGNFMGEILGSKQFDLTSNQLEQVIEVNFDNPIDIGNNDFAIQIIGDFGSDNPDFIYWDDINGNGTNYNHGFKYYPDGGSFCQEGCWVPRLNFGISAKVDYYGDHPPIISEVEKLSDVYYSCDSGPYLPTAHIEDLVSNTISGELTSVKFYYSNGNEVIESELWGYSINNIYTGYIPEHPIGTTISYWWEATDNSASQSNMNQNQITTQRIPYTFKIKEYTPGADILLIDDSSYNTENSPMIDIFHKLNQLGFSSNYINIMDSGILSECSMDYYQHFMVLQGLNGAGNIQPNSNLENYLINRLNNGANLVMSSVDYIYELVDDGGEWIQVNPIDYDFLANYLHVNEFWNDNNQNNLSVSYRGINNNSITNNISQFMVSVPYQFNFSDLVIPDNESLALFELFDNNQNNWTQYGGTMFSGNYKMVFLPWHLEHIDVDSDVDNILNNIFDWMEVEHTPIIINFDGPQGVIFSTSNQQISIIAEDNEGDNITSILNYSVDGSPFIELLMNQTNNNEFNMDIPGQIEGSNVEYFIKIGDGSGYVETEYFQYRIHQSNSDVLLILSNNMEYGEMNFPAEYYTLNFENYLISGNFEYFIEPDYWSMTKDGQTSLELFSYYSTIIEITTTDDYDLYYEYNEHLARINNWLENGNNNYVLAGDETFALASGSWQNIQFNTEHLFYQMGIMESLNDIAFGGISEVFGNESNLLSSQLFNHLADNETLLYDPESIIGYTNWLDGIIPTNSAQISLINDDDIAIVLHKEWENGNKTVFMGIDPISLNSSPNYYWYGASDKGILAQALDWFGDIELAIDNNMFELPQEFKLFQNHPNPFNPTTNIGFDIAEATAVKLIVYNLLGKEIMTLVDSQMAAGSYNHVWNGKNYMGIDVPSGVYFYRLSTNQFTQTNKMILMK